jgi:hypothetical protein
MTLLDKKIEKDLTELYNDGKFSGTISDAENLNKRLGIDGDEKSITCTNGLPGYYTGDRNAKTVFVNLNPGVNARKRAQEFLEFVKSENIDSKQKLIKAAIKRSESFGEDIYANAKLKPDPFDIKTAFFLKGWKDSDISLDINLEDTKNKEANNKVRIAWRNVIKQKLQLELIPYASQAFKSIPKKKMGAILPYVDVLFDEIFSEDRKYIIFASRIFVNIFKCYNELSETGNKIDFIVPNHKFDKISYVSDGVTKTCAFKWSCEVVAINYHGERRKALIANTFPIRALSYGYMEEYGKKCFELWNDTNI